MTSIKDPKVHTRTWREVKAEKQARGQGNPTTVKKHKERLTDEVRAYRLAEVRKAQGHTQTQIANALNIGQSRISALENGDLRRTELGTIAAYVEALGGHLRVVADFGDHTLTIE